MPCGSTTKTPYVIGMTLGGRGIKVSRKGIVHSVGSGTLTDPQVAFLYQIPSGQSMLNSQMAVAKQLAIAHCQRCVLIRGPPHPTKLVHDAEGRRIAKGRRIATSWNDDTSEFETDEDDLHVTLWMGVSVKRIHLAAHMYVQETRDANGNEIVKLMDDPQTQRKHAPEGCARVGPVDFWLTKNTFPETGKCWQQNQVRNPSVPGFDRENSSLGAPLKDPRQARGSRPPSS
ncbi:hypothetical protein B0T26DRAFT_520192 [Lasiosphaeria miniovina]|uniref:Uncharacterized protein n=1 Tax=Lasiosphaeria miniovina TaxID=1954250 RepID=A0AA40DL97_9PEZI|nr:uncharacterized protein B0T26DRAFT_520192 [Lasiosphaeria miniovina]KAK0703998.1 hypothetical protein B0T26DRAFT_520192 [Lasiosphaeria miniovina]